MEIEIWREMGHKNMCDQDWYNVSNIWNNWNENISQKLQQIKILSMMNSLSINLISEILNFCSWKPYFEMACKCQEF